MQRLFVMSMLLMLGAVEVSAADAPASTEWDGLEKKKVKGIDHAYVRPGVDLAAYGKVILDPVVVSFAKDWKVRRAGSTFVVGQEDRERIKARLADLAVKTFAETLSKKDGYPVVTAAGPDVMRVSVSLTDVYVNAPNIPGNARSETYAVNAGSMTLVAELRDSETGAIFARVVDQRQARENAQFYMSNSLQNTTEARHMVEQWAKILRARMDAVSEKP